MNISDLALCFFQKHSRHLSLHDAPICTNLWPKKKAKQEISKLSNVIMAKTRISLFFSLKFIFKLRGILLLDEQEKSAKFVDFSNVKD